MARKSRVGNRVRIDHKQGFPEFHGQTGRIISQEMGMYRVRLDESVHIPGVGRVSDDCWESQYLKNTR